MSDGFGPDDVKDFRAYGAVQGLGCSIVASLIVFILGGLFLDQYLGTTPLLTLIGVGAGLVAAGYQLYELTLINRKDREAGPIGRRFESKTGGRRRQKRRDSAKDNVQ